MPRSSGVNLPGATTSWTGVNTFNNVVNMNQTVGFASALSLASALHTTAVTLTGGAVYHRCDTTAAAFTVTLPAGPIAGQVYVIKAINSTVGTNNLTISGNGHNIDAAATLVIATQYESVMLRYDASATVWEVLAQGAL